MAQLRFAKSSKLGSNWYVRSDGTRSYFFTVDEMCAMVAQAGFEVIEATCVRKVVVNRKEKSEMSRRFVQVRARAVASKGVDANSPAAADADRTRTLAQPHDDLATAV